MAKKSQKKKPTSNASVDGDNWVWVDPARIRFQHARIRPYFSGCGRSVTETLNSIRREELRPEDLPPIQVIAGPDEPESGGRWYFSLNNRRLWVMKRCRDEGLLANNQIRVRVRSTKSSAEEQRYTLENCAVEAKFIRERDPHEQIKEIAEPASLASLKGVENDLEQKLQFKELLTLRIGKLLIEHENDSDEPGDDSSDDDSVEISRGIRNNPFATIQGVESDDSDSDDNESSANANRFSALC